MPHELIIWCKKVKQKWFDLYDKMTTIKRLHTKHNRLEQQKENKG